MIANLKINGLHTGPSGYGVDKTFYSELDAADIPFLAIAGDSEPFDAVQVVRARLNAGKPNIHTVIYRRTLRIDSAPDYDPNVPDASLSPYLAAAKHWAFHKSLLPVFVRDNKDIVWLITTNEPNKDDDSYVEWLAEFSIETAKMAMQDGYKWAAFGWSFGTPEPRHWRQPRMVEFLRLVATNKEKLAIALHEYSGVIDDIWAGGKYNRVGRFTQLLAACDEQGIGHPDIFITEWGWSEHDAPTPSVAMAHITEVGELYARHTAVKGAAIWYLGGGYQDINRKVIKFVEPLKELCLTVEYEVGEPEPEPPAPGKHKAIVVKLPQAMTEAEWLAACKVAYAFKHTVTASHDDTLTVLRGGNDESFVKASHPSRDIEALQLVVDAGYQWEPLYDDEPTFKLVVWPTQYKVVTQEFGANPANYAPFGLPGHEGVDIRAPHGTKIFAAAGGRVFAVETNPDAHNYGIHCRVEHDDGYQTIYAHLLELFVSVGETVGSGALIGLADNTGNSFGDHLHFGMKHYPDGQDGWPSNIIDPTPYLKPLAPEAWEPEIEPPPTGELYPVDFLRADPQAWRVIRRSDGSGEDVWDLPTSTGFVRVKNGSEGEWYNQPGTWRLRDTSPAPDSQGNERLYVQTTNGAEGGKIAPEVAEVGKLYEFYSYVQFMSKDDCRHLAENSGMARSTFKLVSVEDNYTFGTGVTVDRLYVTEQTGETQLYAIKDGRKLGWVGGGASQAGNVWNGELAEVYFDRNIPQNEPKKFCS
jgi:hypothetical protein